MATKLFPRQRALFRSWRSKHQRPTVNRSRMLREEQLEQRTVLSAISPVAPLMEADFNGDGEIGLADLDLINCWVGSEEKANPYHAPMDLNQDRQLDRADVDEMVGFLRTTYGDANYDGSFTSEDIVQLYQHAEYEDDILHNSTWATGDFNGDREFDSLDIIYAFENSVYEPNGDANLDGVVDILDVDLVNCWVGASGGKHGPWAEQIDINRDGTLDRKDADEAIRLVGTTYGDADLDGLFTRADLIKVMQAGKLGGGRATWVEGDFNGDLKATFDDFQVAFEHSVFAMDETSVDIVFAT